MSGAAVDTAASFMRESLSPADRSVRADILGPEDSAGLYSEDAVPSPGAGLRFPGIKSAEKTGNRAGSECLKAEEGR